MKIRRNNNTNANFDYSLYNIKTKITMTKVDNSDFIEGLEKEMTNLSGSPYQGNQTEYQKHIINKGDCNNEP